MALKQSAADNKQRLHHYQWVETQQIALKGEQKPERVFQCSYGPNGQVQKIPMGVQQAPPEKKGIRGRVVEKKTDEMKEYMQQVQSLLSMYVPPNPQLIQQAMQKHNVSIDKTDGLDPDATGLQELRQAWRPDDAGLRRRGEEDLHHQRQYLHGQSARTP